jgi:hypothetical protein
VAENASPRQPVCRVVEAPLEVDGRMVDVRLFSFGMVQRVHDWLTDPDAEPYDEEWMPGCFDHQLNAANRIHANYEHMQGPASIVGHGTALRSEPDGYYATFKIHQTAQGDATLELIRDGALAGVSVEAIPVRNTKTRTGVIQRVKAHCVGMAFGRKGALPGNEILALRTEPEVTIEEELLPRELDAEVVARCRRLGIALPQRYEAHPDTGTPDSSGTPDAAPAEDDNTTSSED